MLIGIIITSNDNFYFIYFDVNVNYKVIINNEIIYC